MKTTIDANASTAASVETSMSVFVQTTAVATIQAATLSVRIAAKSIVFSAHDNDKQPATFGAIAF